jgi:hypothetical protein
VAPDGTGAFMLVVLHVVGVAVVPLNLTVLVPWLALKFVPVMVIEAVITPEVGERLVIPGAATTVNADALLATPLTVTAMFPVVAPVGTGTAIDVALQFVAVAVVPLNFTVLVPCVEPKLVPVMVTDEATAPEAGANVVMLGAATATGTNKEKNGRTLKNKNLQDDERI